MRIIIVFTVLVTDWKAARGDFLNRRILYVDRNSGDMGIYTSKTME